MKNYVKPCIQEVKLDQNICGEVCGTGASWAVSARSGNEYTLCVHFPQQKTVDGKTYTYYASSGGDAIHIKITSHQVISFLENPNCTDYKDLPKSIQDSYKAKSSAYTERAGCGWKKYYTDNNGTCHFFGIIKVGTTEIGSNFKNGDIPGVTKLR